MSANNGLEETNTTHFSTKRYVAPSKPLNVANDGSGKTLGWML